MEFDNACDCKYEQEILEKAITIECTERNIQPKELYKIYKYGLYPAISIKHEKIRIHQLIGKHLIESNPGDNVIHHTDGNKMNNMLSNLEKTNSSDHSKIHKIVRFVPVETMRKNALVGAEARKRKDITSENVKELKEKGLTYSQIAKQLDCGYNTVWRRLFVGLE